MDSAMSIVWWLAMALTVVIFFCGIYMLITGKVLLSYFTIGAGNFTEESKRAFSRPGGISLILGMPGAALFKFGVDGSSNMSMTMIMAGLIMVIVALVFYFIGRSKLVRA